MWCHRLSAEIVSLAKGREMQPFFDGFLPTDHVKVKSREKRYQALPCFTNFQEESLGTRLIQNMLLGSLVQGSPQCTSGKGVRERGYAVGRPAELTVQCRRIKSPSSWQSLLSGDHGLFAMSLEVACRYRQVLN